ncbi:FAD-dependent oxidoreductase [Ilumatobacter nonamiensis]|uniref:FAD-dependent oxidoreductase n=1 Tax=Ilumatobacter nonamiensis TaxID=467093 RepID=UPI00034B4685|nr:FAD-dependent oxidoreductase [Ilumatobacter nonamiensis]
MSHDSPPVDPSHADVHVIGGGLGGLAAAALVARAGRSVTVHEGRGRLGGRATTDSKDGYRFNQGPHALYLAGEGHRVLRAFGIAPSGTAPNTKGARMVRDGQVGLAPGDPVSLLRSSVLGWRDKVALAGVLNRIDRLDPATLGSVTTGEWVDDLSPRARVREIIHTVIRLGTYVNAPDVLSADVALMQVQLALGDGVIYLDRGWEQLVDALAAVEGITVVRDEPVRELPDARCVIVATGAPSSVTALTGQRFDELGPSADVSVLDIGLTTPPTHDVVLGIDPPMYLSNHGFPAGMTPAGRSSMSVAEYLAPDTAPDRERLRAFLTHAGVAPESVETERYLHRMTAVTAISTAAAGGLRRRPDGVVPDRAGVFVVGDWVGRRGHLLDAVLASAEDAARNAVAHLDRQPSVR